MQVQGRGAVGAGVGGRGVVVVVEDGGGVCTCPRPLLSPHGRAARWAAGAGCWLCWLAGLLSRALRHLRGLAAAASPSARAASPQSSAARSTCSSNTSLLWRTAVVSTVFLSH